MTERDRRRLYMLETQVRAGREFFANHKTKADEIFQRKAIEDMAFLLNIIQGLMVEEINNRATQ